jgi:hypothetical protein
MRSLVRRLTLRPEEKKKHIALGLVNENGRFVWEDPSPEEIHEFRRYVYEKLRFRKQHDGKLGGGNLLFPPGPA